MADVHWPKHEMLTYYGRNGTAFCTGVSLLPVRTLPNSPGRILLTPFNSKGLASGCDLDIPYSAIDEVIAALQKIKREEEHSELHNTPQAVTTD